MWYGSVMSVNPYYNPQDFDPPLKLWAELDMTTADYTFDIRLVWVTEWGAVYTAFDSGCSCPVPFEDFIWASDLTEVVDDLEGLDNEPLRWGGSRYMTFEQLREEARQFGQRSDEDNYYDIPPDQDAISQYLKLLDTLERGVRL